MPSVLENKSFEERLQSSTEIRERYPDRLPCIVEKASSRGAISAPSLDKNKFLVPQDLTLSQFVFVIRRRLQLDPQSALFVYAGGQMPATTMLIRELCTLPPLCACPSLASALTLCTQPHRARSRRRAAPRQRRLPAPAVLGRGRLWRRRRSLGAPCCPPLHAARCTPKPISKSYA